VPGIFGIPALREPTYLDAKHAGKLSVEDHGCGVDQGGMGEVEERRECARRRRA
jgi:hypothetical protein